MSNPPVPFIVRKLRGNPGKRPLRNAPEPALLPECPKPPPFLSPYAQDEWWRVGPQLWTLGLLTTLDVSPLAAYCHAYGTWREAAEALERVAACDEAMRGLLIKTQDGNARRNPLIKIAADAAADMIRFAAEFGLTPIARTRIAQGIHQQPPSKFAGLLAGSDEGDSK